jgi:hypothetical protein
MPNGLEPGKKRSAIQADGKTPDRCLHPDVDNDPLSSRAPRRSTPPGDNSKKRLR